MPPCPRALQSLTGLPGAARPEINRRTATLCPPRPALRPRHARSPPLAPPPPRRPADVPPLQIDAASLLAAGRVEYVIAYQLVACRGAPAWRARLQITCCDGCDADGAAPPAARRPSRLADRPCLDQRPASSPCGLGGPRPTRRHGRARPPRSATPACWAAPPNPSLHHSYHHPRPQPAPRKPPLPAPQPWLLKWTA